MKIPEHLTDIFTFENLLRAYKKASKNKRNKKDVSKFREHLYQNIYRIEKTFKHSKYPEIKYHSFIVEQPKRREVWATTFEIRVIMHCFCDEFLTEFFEQFYSERNCACRKGMGPNYAGNCLKQDMVDHFAKYGNSGYVLKADIHHYFQSIDHTILKDSLSIILPSGEIRDFLFYIIDSFSPGLPLGNQTSQLLALYYLSPVDEYIRNQQNLNYTRYMDDFVAIIRTKQDAMSNLKEVEDMVKNQLHLELNSKTTIQTLKNGIGFLGWNYSLKETGKFTKRRMKNKKQNAMRKMKQAIYLYQTGRIDSRSYSNRVSSIFATLDTGNAYEFKRVLVKLQYKKRN